MKYTKLLAVSLFALMFFTACPQKEDEMSKRVEEVLGEHTLKFGETLTTEDNFFSMTFGELVSDSRCPLSVVCVWEGLAEIKFTLLIDGEMHTLVLIAHEGHPEKAIGELAGYTINLTEVAPYPDDAPIPDADYVVTFTIE